MDCHLLLISARVHTPLRHAVDSRAAAYWIGLRDMSLNHIRICVRSHAIVWQQKTKAYLTIRFWKVHGALKHKQSGHTQALSVLPNL